MSIRELTCIICPKGCMLKTELDESGKVISVTGNSCKRGREYAEAECVNPMRTVTSTMRCSDGSVIPVKTDSPIPKSEIFRCMEIIDSKIVNLPVEIGTVVIPDVFGSNIVVTENRTDNRK